MPETCESKPSRKRKLFVYSTAPGNIRWRKPRRIAPILEHCKKMSSNEKKIIADTLESLEKTAKPSHCRARQSVATLEGGRRELGFQKRD